MDPLDKLLAQIKAEYDREQSQQLPTNPNVSQPPSPPPINTSNSFIDDLLEDGSESGSFIDNLLAEVKADIEAQEQAEELRKQQEIEQERIKQAKIKAKQREALKKQAQDWLAKLDPFSPEGLWFERFAESYPSKLDAAIEYLQSN